MIQQTLSGDGIGDLDMTVQALDLFLRQIERRAFGMARLSTGNADDALDIVQDAMMKFARKYAQKPQSEWTPLFYRVLQNQIVDWQRRSTVRNRWKAWLGFSNESGEPKQDPMENIADPGGDNPERNLRRQNAMEKLQAAVTKLPERQKQVFLLRIWEGLDVKDTAGALRISEGSVKTHLSRALGHLKTQLEGHWP